MYNKSVKNKSIKNKSMSIKSMKNMRKRGIIILGMISDKSNTWKEFLR